MPNRCVVGGCSNTSLQAHTRLWPKNEVIGIKWDRFVKSTRADPWKRGNSNVICSKHFNPDDYHNYGQYMQGCAKRLALTSTAIPFILAKKLAVNVHTVTTPKQQIPKQRPFSEPTKRACIQTPGIKSKRSRVDAEHKISIARISDTM